jgi:transcriptional regulator with XRE-family HTH domain
MDTNTNIIRYLINEKNFKQKDIAEKLNVKDAQISKWKLAVSIPAEREVELMKIAGVYWERENNIRPTSTWALLVESKENEDKWFDYFKKLFNDASVNPFPSYERYSIAKNLISENELAEIFLTRFNEAGIFIPKDPPSYTDPYSDPEAWHHFASTYVMNYLQLENWCCENLNIENSYERDFFDFLPRYAILKMTIEEDTDLNEQVPNPFDLNEYKQFLIEQSYEIESSIIHSARYQGLDVSDSMFVDLIEYPKQKNPKKSINADFDEFTTFDTSDNEESDDQYLSYGERKLLKEIKANQKLLTQVLMKLDTL